MVMMIMTSVIATIFTIKILAMLAEVLFEDRRLTALAKESEAKPERRKRSEVQRKKQS